MKIKKFFFILCIIMTSVKITSCKSIVIDKAFIEEKISENTSLVTGKISVTVNNTDEKNLCSQINDLVELKLKNLNNNKADSENHYKLDITIKEQTFIQNFENKYSLFISAKIFDTTEKLIYSNCFYSTSDRSIVSGRLQAELINTIINNIKESLYHDRKRNEK